VLVLCSLLLRSFMTVRQGAQADKGQPVRCSVMVSQVLRDDCAVTLHCSLLISETCKNPAGSLVARGSVVGGAASTLVHRSGLPVLVHMQYIDAQ